MSYFYRIQWIHVPYCVRELKYIVFCSWNFVIRSTLKKKRSYMYNSMMTVMISIDRMRKKWHIYFMFYLFLLFCCCFWNVYSAYGCHARGQKRQNKKKSSTKANRQRNGQNAISNGTWCSHFKIHTFARSVCQCDT